MGENMTFEEWYEKERAKFYLADLMDDYENHPSEDKIKDLMKCAWDARYNTLTYHDI